MVENMYLVNISPLNYVRFSTIEITRFFKEYVINIVKYGNNFPGCKSKTLFKIFESMHKINECL